MRAPTNRFTRELQVGLFVATALFVIAAFSLRITDNPVFRRGTVLTTYLEDASGIFKNSKVKMAGINIGVITRIELEDKRARITLLIDPGIKLPANAKIVPRPLGILGDKYLEVTVPEDSFLQKIWKFLPAILPEAYAQGEKKTQDPLKSGDVITASQSSASIDDITRTMARVADDLKAISSILREMAEGKTDPKSPLGRTMKNVENITEHVDALVQENRGNLRETLASMKKVMGKVEKAVEGFDSEKFRKDIRDLSKAVGNVSSSVQHMESILGKIDRGEGSLGKLVNDSETVDNLNRSLSEISSTLTRARKTQILVDLRPEYAFLNKATKTYAGLMLMPREDTGYLLQLVVDSEGKKKTEVISESVNGGAPTTTTKVTQDKGSLKFSFQFYKRIYDLGFRLGVFESTGGVALETYMFGDSVQLYAEAFDFAREGDNLQVKTGLRFYPWRYFYLTGGGTDLVSKNEKQRSLFGGAGLTFTDNDLANLFVFASLR